MVTASAIFLPISNASCFDLPASRTNMLSKKSADPILFYNAFVYGLKIPVCISVHYSSVPVRMIVDHDYSSLQSLPAFVDYAVCYLQPDGVMACFGSAHESTSNDLYTRHSSAKVRRSISVSDVGYEF